MDLVLVDIFLKGELTGIDLAHILNDRHIAFVYLSANSTGKTLEAAKATHPYGFLIKPVREKDVLIMLDIAHYVHEHNMDALKQKNRAGVRAAAVADKETTANHFCGIIGQSARLLDALDLLQIVAPTDTSVLITGESGTGKERFAQCIHDLSSRKMHPLITVNCAAMPATLIESILFGHERGAFTGATERQTGKFEQAHKGTIFLDEIGELSPDTQVKLLRTLQEREIERLGGTEPIKVDVRIIAATNRNLEKEVAEGRFRIDLYYRLHVFPIAMPALRERREDIPLLSRHFMELFCRKLGRSPAEIADGAMERLVAHSWPGNIRELENVIERAVLLSREGGIRNIEFAPYAFEEPRATASDRIKTMEENERDHIISALNQCNGKIFGKGGAAELLHINANTLNSRIIKLGIDKKIFR